MISCLLARPRSSLENQLSGDSLPTIDFEAIVGALPDDWDGTLSLEVFTLDYGYVGVSKEYLDDVLVSVES